MSVKDKVIVITGASSGIGAATVRQLIAGGAKVVFGARREQKLRDLAATLPAEQIAYCVTDVTKPDDVQALAELAVSRFGKIDALYNNAGIMPVAPLAADHRDEWQAMLDTNVMGVLNGISAVLPIMHHQGFGHILATDSVAGYVIYPNLAVYCGTKFAVRAIMESLRQEERPNKIKTTLIDPGAVDSELYRSTSDPKVAQGLVDDWHQPDKSITPDDIASAIVYAIGQPDIVAVNEMVIRPIGQAQ